MKLQITLTATIAALLAACSPGEEKAPEAKADTVAAPTATPAKAEPAPHPDDDAVVPGEAAHDEKGDHKHDGEDADHAH